MTFCILNNKHVFVTARMFNITHTDHALFSARGGTL